jgi:hypothetical protein
MLSKCANPACSTPFQYLREGKLFQIEMDSPPRDGIHLVAKRPARKVEFFWLCGRCSSQMTLAYQRGKGVITLPLPPAARVAIAS